MAIAGSFDTTFRNAKTLRFPSATTVAERGLLVDQGHLTEEGAGSAGYLTRAEEPAGTSRASRSGADDD
jgi:hypothetical protein